MSRSELERQFNEIKSRNISLNLTRGKPSSAQVALSDALDGILLGDFICRDGVDSRNYGGMRGIPECRELGSYLTDYPADLVMAGGNSSLQLMYLVLSNLVEHGLAGATPLAGKDAKALCPVPGYDRHFAATEYLGLDMVNVELNDDGPNMDQVEELVRNDPTVACIWCVPKHSNPTGCTYSDEVVARIAALPQLRGDADAHPFYVFWDNAYAVHDFTDDIVELAPIYTRAIEANSLDRILVYASTSKITHAGAGVAFLASSENVLADLEERLGYMIIGFDKVNQLRHARMFPSRESLQLHMHKHAQIVRPLFETAEAGLQTGLGNAGLATWSRPSGGYFVSLDVKPGTAKEVVRLAASAGLQLTAAGATYPYGNDPMDANIRIAPTFATAKEVATAMEIVGLSVQLAASLT
ncbi:MAG: aminotransferase [Gammaproteobacteria bacterium]|nr:aminotransferase [Gammaproteobacteria bacterium]